MQAHAYLKSTDGHHGTWAFNLRRPSLPPTAGTSLSLQPPHFSSKKAGLCSKLILVDSTRAGKRLPDALSKTVPIWGAVVNRDTHLRSLAEASSSLDVATAEAADLGLDFDPRTPPGESAPTSTP